MVLGSILTVNASPHSVLFGSQGMVSLLSTQKSGYPIEGGTYAVRRLGPITQSLILGIE